MADYKLVKCLDFNNAEQINVVLHKESNTFIPFDPANTDYQEFLAWKAEGNEPEPADE